MIRFVRRNLLHQTSTLSHSRGRTFDLDIIQGHDTRQAYTSLLLAESGFERGTLRNPRLTTRPLWFIWKWKKTKEFIHNKKNQRTSEYRLRTHHLIIVMFMAWLWQCLWLDYGNVYGLIMAMFMA
ncbi:hypothetical protein AVEN_28148-1 [Araneus ventricosus]|uniref:Uncharacterized protein n=1 Tax=Araneus ventricosus TaxID=182803 RepID=A0A4Y2V5F9_ARAVE|nr:hypothetical protein AVEN_28148-1 [Araneus ventricosus]